MNTPASTASAITDEQIDAIDLRKFQGKHALRDFARAVLALNAAAVEPSQPAPAAPSEWQPIESVPNIQDDILLLKTTGRQAIETGWYARNLLEDAIREGDTCVYTAWMHLPAAIEASTKGAAS